MQDTTWRNQGWAKPIYGGKPESKKALAARLKAQGEAIRKAEEAIAWCNERFA